MSELTAHLIACLKMTQKTKLNTKKDKADFVLNLSFTQTQITSHGDGDGKGTGRREVNITCVLIMLTGC